MNKSEKFWDRQSKNYERQVEGENKSLESAKKYLKSSDVVLDYACATGLISNEIAGLVKEVHGIDISAGMIETANREAGERNIPNAFFRQGTIFDEEYKKGTFDVVLAFNILHLLENIERDIQRVHELLKPEGFFISTTPCLGESNFFLRFIIPLLSKVGFVPKVQLLKMAELDDAIADNNFDITETEKEGDSVPNYFIVAKKEMNASLEQ